MRKTNTPAVRPCAASRTVLPGFLFSLLVYAGSAQAQCLSTGPATGTLFTVDNPTSGLAFHASANAAHSDNSYASAQPLTALVGQDHTPCLRAGGFNFSIPANAVICAVTVRVKKRAVGISEHTFVSDEEVKLVIGGVLSGQNKGSAAPWSSDLATESYSGDAAYWGTPLTPADVNAPGFGVALSAKLSSTVAAFPRAEIDQVSMMVEYQVSSAAPQSVEQFTTAIDKNIVSCEWTMTEEQAGSRIILQQSTDNRQWKDINAYTISAPARQVKYRQVARLETKGTYYHRVKVVAKEGSAAYSKTTRLQYTSSGELKVYPTVAKSMLYVENTDPSDKIQVYNFSNQLMPTSTVPVKDGLIAVRISELPRGRYILKAGRATRQFIKD